MRIGRAAAQLRRRVLARLMHRKMQLQAPQNGSRRMEEVMEMRSALPEHASRLGQEIKRTPPT